MLLLVWRNVVPNRLIFKRFLCGKRHSQVTADSKMASIVWNVNWNPLKIRSNAIWKASISHNSSRRWSQYGNCAIQNLREKSFPLFFKNKAEFSLNRQIKLCVHFVENCSFNVFDIFMIEVTFRCRLYSITFLCCKQHTELRYWANECIAIIQL